MSDILGAIDDAVSYLESPEYLRQTAESQGVSPAQVLAQTTNGPAVPFECPCGCGESYTPEPFDDNYVPDIRMSQTDAMSVTHPDTDETAERRNMCPCGCGLTVRDVLTPEPIPMSEVVAAWATVFEPETPDTDSTRYTIVRHFQNSRRRFVIQTGLTLGEAQAHCQDPETSSSTCTGQAGRRRTARFGPWFESYTAE